MIESKIAVTINLCLFVSAALAQIQTDQVEIKRSDELALTELVDDVLERYPVYEELPARLEEAAKFDKKASSLVADSTNLVVRYQTGQIGNNNNLREYEAGVEFSLWRFGERKASQQVAHGMELEANTFAALVRWELAGVLRTALWRIALTADRVAKTEDAAEVSVDLLRSIERRVDLGSLPRSDLLQAKQDKLNSEIRLSTAQIEYANAVRAYRIITDQNVIPADFSENRSTKNSIEEQHPALVHSAARLERASAEFRLTQESGTGNPALMLGMRSERAATDPSFEDSVGVSFSYPLGFGAHVNAERAAAGVRAAEVRAKYRKLRQQLETSFHNAEQNLAGAEREYHLTRQKSELAQQHLSMSLRALELGEMNLMAFLLIKEAAFDADMDASTKEFQWRIAIAEYNQAVGELP